jgi:hypothetical protein
MYLRQSDVRALKAAGLLDSNDGAFSKWMHLFGERDIGVHDDEQLGLARRRTLPMKEKREKNEDLKPPPPVRPTTN